MADENTLASPLQDLNLFGDNYTFEEQDFRDAITERGIGNIASGLVGIAQESDSVAPGLFTYETLKDGTAEFFNLLPASKDRTADERKLSDDDIVTYFSNVTDFGGGNQAKTKTLMDRIKRNLAPAAGMLGGGIYGARAGVSIPASDIRVKLGAGFLGFLGGTLAGTEAGQQITKYFAGEAQPVVPVLQKFAVAGETIPYAFSVMASPWMLPSKTGGLGAVNFLDKFRKVSSSGNATISGKGGTSLNDRNLALAAKDAGLSVKDYVRATVNQQKAQGSKTIRDMFRPDPSKGPVDMRLIAALERGLVTAGQAGRGELGAGALVASGVIDTISGAGATYGGFLAETLKPNEPGYRIGYEIAGSLAPGVVTIAGIKGVGLIPQGFNSAKNFILKNLLKKEGLVSEVAKKDAIRRVYAALESTTELSSPEQLTKFLEDLGSFKGPIYEYDDVGAIKLDGLGNPIELKLTASNVAGAKNLPLQKTLGIIDQELARAGEELSIQSSKGRTAFLQGSKNAIMLLRKSGEPEAFKLATAIEENLFKINITDNIQAAINILMSSANRLTREESILPSGKSLKDAFEDAGSSELNLGKKLRDLLIQQNKNSKARGREFWNAVGDETIEKFFLEDGTELNKPNLLQYLNELDFGGSKALQQTFKNDLGELKLDINDIKKMFGEGGEDLISPPNLDKISGTGGEKYILDSLPGGERFQAKRAQLAENGVPFSGDADQERLIAIRILREMADNAASPDLKGLTVREASDGFGVSGGLSTVRKFTSIFNEEADKLAAIASGEAEDLGTISVQRLQNMRSLAGDKAAEFERKNRPLAAKLMRGFQAAVLRDLMGSSEDGSTALSTARAYTAARYTAFGTDTFPGQVNKKDGRGRFVMAPEAVLKEFFSAGANPLYLRNLEVMRAADFMVENGVADASLLRGETTDVLEAVLRHAQKNILDEKQIEVNGETQTVYTVNAAKLKRFKNDDSNKRLLSMFPAVHYDLENVQKAQRLFDSVGSEIKILQKSDEVKAFKTVMGSENPSLAVSKALSSDSPAASLMELINFANTNEKIINKAGKVFTNQQAREGLMNGIVDQGVQYAGGMGATFNPQKFNDFMFTPRPRGDLKDELILGNYMVKNNLMTQDQLTNMKKAVSEMINVDDALSRGDLETVLFKNPTGMKALRVKMLGAALGGVAQKKLSGLLEMIGLKGGGGGTLVAASEGSKQLQNILLVGPESIRQKYMVELLSDAKLLSTQLLKLQTNNQKNASNRTIEKWVANLGLNTVVKRGYLAGMDRDADRFENLESLSTSPADIEVEEIEEPVSNVTPQPKFDQVSSVQTPALKPPTQVSANLPRPGLNVNAGGPPVSNQQVDRARFASFFPEDRALIEGIGSLV